MKTYINTVLNLLIILVAVCSCGGGSTMVATSNPTCKPNQMPFVFRFYDDETDAVLKQYEADLKSELDKFMKEKYDIGIHCLGGEFPRPKQPEPLCEREMDPLCVDRDLDIAKKLDYLRELDKWAKYAEALCAKHPVH